MRKLTWIIWTLIIIAIATADVAAAEDRDFWRGNGAPDRQATVSQGASR